MTPDDRRTALVIVPTYNERENLPVLVDGADASIPNVSVLVVDDQSPDGTGEVADALAREYPGRVEVMHRTGAPRPWAVVPRRHPVGARSSPSTSSARWTRTCRTIPRHLPRLIAASRARRRRDRLALRAGRRGRELAAAAAAAQPVREHLHPHGHAPERARLHQRLSLLAARGARALPLDQIRSDGYAFLVEMLFVAAARGPDVSPKCRSPSSSGGRANRSCRSAVLLESAITPWRLDRGAADRRGRTVR